ncbi:hypothetical protein CRX72_15805 [Pantoea sp. BRM17]|nr:hypothetical protein CRX72_15805 [Pantoea sp. BRM17]
MPVLHLNGYKIANPTLLGRTSDEDLQQLFSGYEGTYSEIYPQVSEDEQGMQRLFKQFSFPGGIPSHAAPETPGSINEGGELGYSLSHAFGAAFDHPDLMANPLLRETLLPEHIKPRLLGHWGTTPGLNFIYAHLNRVIRQRNADLLYVCGPGHGGPGMVANSWLEINLLKHQMNIVGGLIRSMLFSRLRLVITL